MSYKLIWAQENEIREGVQQLSVGRALTEIGTYNKLPEPFTEVSEHEFFHSRGMASPRWITNHQIRDADQCERLGFSRNTFVAIQIEWYNDRAYGIIWPRQWTTPTKEEHEAGAFFIKYTDRPRYLRFGCLHKNQTGRTVGRCLTEYTCHDCGYIHQIDSSD